MATDKTKSVRTYAHPTNEHTTYHNPACTPSVTYKDASISSSTDPFSGKTNKYAESALVEIRAVTQGVHVVWGDSSVAAADANDYLIPAGESKIFAVIKGKEYLRLIEAAASATVYVTEIY